MKIFIGNGYYYVNRLGYLNINKNDNQKKKCLNNGDIIKNKETLKGLFRAALIRDLSENNIKSFWCVAHDSFIDIIEHSGFKIKRQLKIYNKVNIDELFKYWKCDDCGNCKHRNECYICNGQLPTELRDEYLLLFIRDNK